MLGKKLLGDLKKINPTFDEYRKAKEIIKLYENNLEKNSSIIYKKFYVLMGSDYYSVGTFGGFKNERFMLKIQDIEPFSHIPDSHFIETDIESVFERKTDKMKFLHAGIE